VHHFPPLLMCVRGVASFMSETQHDFVHAGVEDGQRPAAEDAEFRFPVTGA